MAMRESAVDCPAPALVLEDRLGRRRAEELARLFRALGDSGRLRLLSFLAGQPDGEACVCNLTRPLGLTQPTVSHHLRVLTEAGLLARERRGTWMYYRLRLERLAELRDALAPPAQLTVALRRKAARKRAS
jgi:ArsR family transcriptional regulator